MGDILLVEPAEAVSENVKEANTLRSDPLAATRLVSTPSQIKEKINSQMSSEGRYMLNDQFSEATICDINGNNLVNGEYFSYVAKDGNQLYMAKNNPETEVYKFSLSDKKLEDNNIVAEVPQEEVASAPVEAVVETPVEESVSQEVVEVPSIPENINQGFAKEDIDSKDLVDNTIPEKEEVVETPVEENNEVVGEAVPVTEETTDIENKEEVVEEISPETVEDTTKNENVDDILKRLEELQNKYRIDTSNNEKLGDVITEETPNEEVEEENISDVINNSETEETAFDDMVTEDSEIGQNITVEDEADEDIFKDSVKIDSIDSNYDEDIDEYEVDDLEDKSEGDYENSIGDTEAEVIVDNIVENLNKTAELREENETLKEQNEVLQEENEALKEKLRVANRTNTRLEKEVQALKFKNSALDTKNQSLESTIDENKEEYNRIIAKQEEQLRNKDKIIDLTKRENGELKVKNKKFQESFARLAESAVGLDDPYQNQKVA